MSSTDNVRPWSFRRPNINSLFLPPTTMFWDAGEHMVTPLNLPFPPPVNTVPARTFKMTFNGTGFNSHPQNGLQLTYGQIVALGGDFYADPANPVSSQAGFAAQQAQMKKNVDSLFVLPTSNAEANSILEVMKKEVLASQAMVLRGLPPSLVYSTDYWDLQYNGITGGSYVSFKLGQGRYLLIAATNWDHFGKDALTSYAAAHAVAMQMANNARNANDLQQAYAVNAFADHYLTDLFAAGHLRTPRRQMWLKTGFSGNVPLSDSNYDSIASGKSGVIARSMHDEDNLNGLWVINTGIDLPDQWLCFGDGHYRDAGNAANAALVQKAVATSIQEVYAAFDGGVVVDDPSKYKALKLVPTQNSFDSRYNTYAGFNYSPMLIARDSDVLRRDDLTDLRDSTYDTFSIPGLYDALPSQPQQGPALLQLEPMTLHSVSEGGIINPVGSFGVTPLMPPPLSFSVASDGSLTAAFLRGAEIVYARRGGGASTWSTLGTITGDIGSAPAVPPNPIDPLFFYITGNDLDSSGAMIAGSLQEPITGRGVMTSSSDGGSLGSLPVVASPQNGEAGVFALGASVAAPTLCFRLWLNGWAPNWQSVPLPSTPAGPPAVVAMAPSDYRVLLLDTHGRMWCLTITLTATSASNAGSVQIPLPGAKLLTSLPGAASWGAGRLDCVARNTDGTLSHTWYQGGSWQGEVVATINTLSNPSLVALGGPQPQLSLFYVGNDRSLHCSELTATSPQWRDRDLNLKAISAPLAVATASLNRVDVMVVGVDNNIHHTWCVTGSSWSAWETVSTN